MSLLQKIQSLAVDSSSDISELLRHCKILAFRLDNNELKKWVDLELNGYLNADELPEYRIVDVSTRGHFFGSFGRELKNGEISLHCIEKEHRKYLDKAYAMQPISAYLALVRSATDGQNFKEFWPAELVAMYHDKMYEEMSCLSAWKEIPYSSLVALIDVVRNRILNFALEIEAEDSRAGDVSLNDLGSTSLTPEKIMNVFHNTIIGNVGNLSEGGSDYSQNAAVYVTAGDFQALHDQLVQFGIEEQDIQALNIAIEEDRESEDKESRALGKKVKAWIAKVTSGLKPLAQNISADLIVKAILMYYGIQ
ncbi:MAG: hypothetical protein HGA31_01175 [Candidatus Moranbacteria bacterium]|nr:hypothetical protein [Candidatus Moranbacteria bacterium]